MCDVCNSESGAPDVGVAAVPAAPVSVMWCRDCLNANAVPRFVVETWLFADFGPWADDPKRMPEEPPPFPLADWVGVMSIWMGPERRYVTVRNVYPELWADQRRELLHGAA